MEELNNVSSAPQAVPQDARKPYTPPTADIILLVTKEELAGWDYGYHDSSAGDRWVLNGWGYNTQKDSTASGVYGKIKPADTWTLQSGE